METNKTKDLKTYKQIFYYLVNVAEMYPQYTIAQHFSHIMRKKDDLQDPYFWSNQKMLSKIEGYYEELNNDLHLITKEEKDY